ncbi:MAG: hypothetical protein H8E44_08025 [Planctomycetes bacterium]|nr:hypothetical protein [Planctomycetota bacterium]MBL7037107.1 hypothetical protein [Pirellulaceae bacterium]
MRAFGDVADRQYANDFTEHSTVGQEFATRVDGPPNRPTSADRIDTTEHGLADSLLRTEAIPYGFNLRAWIDLSNRLGRGRNLGLSGGLPLRAAAEDTWIKTTINNTNSRNAAFAVFSLEDLAVLRLASLPAVLASGLSTLSGPTLDQFGYLLGIKDNNGQSPFAPVVEVKRRSSSSGARRVLQLDIESPFKNLIVVGWSPARLTIEKSEELEKLVTHFRRIERHLHLDLGNVHLWQPAKRDMEGIIFCAKHGKPKDFSESLKSSIDQSTCELTWLPSQASVPKNLPAAVVQLQEAILGVANDRDREAKFWTNYQRKINDEVVRPLTEQATASNEPTEKAVLMAMAGISQLAHPQAMAIAAKVVRSVKERGVCKSGPLPEEELQQLLRMSDRIVALAKEREQIKGGKSKW